MQTTMMTKTRKTLLAAIFIGTVGLFAWPGCITPPLPSERYPVGSRTKETFIVPKSSPLTRDEAIQKFGSPDEVYPEIGVISYKVNQVVKRHLWLFLFVIPVNVDRWTYYSDVAYMSFDSQGRLQYSGIETVDHNSPEKAAAWLEKQKKKDLQKSR
jgi:hypothetical protein